jgi:amidohydrolase
MESIPGSLFRLGTRRPGSGEEFDIHQPMFDVDERCIGVGIKVMAAIAMMAIGDAQDAVSAVVTSADDVTLAGPLLAG